MLYACSFIVVLSTANYAIHCGSVPVFVLIVSFSLFICMSQSRCQYVVIGALAPVCAAAAHPDPL